jgi:hypothetical protein
MGWGGFGTGRQDKGKDIYLYLRGRYKAEQFHSCSSVLLLVEWETGTLEQSESSPMKSRHDGIDISNITSAGEQIIFMTDALQNLDKVSKPAVTSKQT